MTHWTEFLDAQGAHIDTQGFTRFVGDDKPRSGSVTYLTELGYQGVLSVTGLDAIKFLQGQITADVRGLADGRSLVGAQCNLKGRMIGSFRLAVLNADNSDHSDSTSIALRLPRDVLPLVLAALQKYSVFSKVTLADISDDWRLFGLTGSEAGELLGGQTGLRPDTDGQTRASDTVVVIRHTEERYECWVKRDKAEKLWLSLAEHCQLQGSRYWQLEDIRAGLGEVYGLTTETFTPQALNFQLTGAVSFKKGCYTGQEVVARLHYKATLKKQMMHIGFSDIGFSDTAGLPAPGDPITDGTGKSVGECVMAAPAEPGRIEALAVLPINDAGELFIGPAAQLIERLPLPYRLSEDDNGGD